MKSAHEHALEPWQVIEVQHLHRLEDVSVDALAERYGVSRRTIYRCLNVRVERINLRGWEAWFALSTDKPPQRMTLWEPAA